MNNASARLASNSLATCAKCGLLTSLIQNGRPDIQSQNYGLQKISHLGKNPLNCDCNLRWLFDYLETYPTTETSEARCESPSRVQNKQLAQLNKSELKCQEHSTRPTASAEQQSSLCPSGCVCSGSSVDCSRMSSVSLSLASQQQQATSEPAPGVGTSSEGGPLYELPDVPEDLPVYVARVHINDNRIKRIRQTGLFRKLANSQKLDLGNNKIVDIEDNAINGQLANGQKPERVIFVLLENQHCPASNLPATGVTTSARQANSGTTESGTLSGLQKSNSQQQQQRADVLNEDPCALAPKVNEPQFDSPCYNGGACKSASMVAPGASRFQRQATSANFTCQCQLGFGGPLCEINFDDCVDHQCQNGAMCVDGINSYKCICRDPTTSGEFCEQLNNENSIKNANSNNNNLLLFNSPPYATNSANSIAPMALPIIAQRTSVSGSSNELAQAQQQPQSQIIARSADFLRQPDDLGTNSLATQSVGAQTPRDSLPEPVGGCRRLTKSSYFDDENGCQSVRLLKINECAGSCSDGAGSCCVPSKIKRRRIHMQCSDGASYVKVIDLVKKCSCSQEAASCPANKEAAAQALFGSSAGKKQNFIKYSPHGASKAQARERASLITTAGPTTRNAHMNPAQDDQLLQITRLDAVE